MALTITPSITTVNQNQTVTFVASAGTGPYVFSLVSGIGSINASTGVYTAPPQTGVAVVRVTDATTATADANITVHSALTRLCDILKTELDLDDDQIILYDQRLPIVKDERLYVAVGVLSCKPFSNTRESIPVVGGFTERLSTNFQAMVSLDVLSRGSDARDRKEEVILALNSQYSYQQQTAFGFHVAPLTSSFANLSGLDGTAIPYRFSISVNLIYYISKTKAVDYYDDFEDAEVLVNQ